MHVLVLSSLWYTLPHLAHIIQNLVGLCKQDPQPLYFFSYELLQDFFSDSYVLFHSILGASAVDKPLIEDLVVPWVVFYCIAAVASLISMVFKIQAFIQQLRERHNVLSNVYDDTSKTGSRLQKHRKRLVKAQRAIKLTYASILVGTAECFPLGLLQVLYSLHLEHSLEVVAMLSLISTWTAFGMKVAKSAELEKMWRYKKKQQKKCQELGAPGGAPHATLVTESSEATKSEDRADLCGTLSIEKMPRRK